MNTHAVVSASHSPETRAFVTTATLSHGCVAEDPQSDKNGHGDRNLVYSN